MREKILHDHIRITMLADVIALVLLACTHWAFSWAEFICAGLVYRMVAQSVVTWIVDWREEDGRRGIQKMQ